MSIVFCSIKFCICLFLLRHHPHHGRTIVQWHSELQRQRERTFAPCHRGSAKDCRIYPLLPKGTQRWWLIILSSATLSPICSFIVPAKDFSIHTRRKTRGPQPEHHVIGPEICHDQKASNNSSPWNRGPRCVKNFTFPHFFQVYTTQKNKPACPCMACCRKVFVCIFWEPLHLELFTFEMGVRTNISGPNWPPSSNHQDLSNTSAGWGLFCCSQVKTRCFS